MGEENSYSIYIFIFVLINEENERNEMKTGTQQANEKLFHFNINVVRSCLLLFTLGRHALIPSVRCQGLLVWLARLYFRFRRNFLCDEAEVTVIVVGHSDGGPK